MQLLKLFFCEMCGILMQTELIIRECRLQDSIWKGSRYFATALFPFYYCLWPSLQLNLDEFSH